MYDNPRDSSRRIHIRPTASAGSVIERALSPLVFGRILLVAFIIAAAGVAKASVVCHRPAGLLDIYPTLAGLCGFGVPEAVDGASMKPLIDNQGLEYPYSACASQQPMNHGPRTERRRCDE